MPEIRDKTLHSFSSEDPVSQIDSMWLKRIADKFCNSNFFSNFPRQICLSGKLRKSGSVRNRARRAVSWFSSLTSLALFRQST